MVNYSQDYLSTIFRALSDPTRRGIVQQLMAGPSRVTDIASRFDMSLPAVSKHVRILEEAGLLGRDRQGRVHHLSLKAEPMKQAQEWIEQYRVFWEGNLDSLERYFGDKEGEKEHE